MIIDFHTHIFPRDVRHNREKHIRMDRTFRLLYGDRRAKLVGVEELIEAMDQAGIDKSVICGFPWLNQELCIRGNDYLLDAMDRYPGRLIGFASFSPLVPKGVVPELERCISSGMKGVGEHGLYTRKMGPKEIRRIGPIIDTVKELKVPLLVHINEPIGHHYPGKVDMTLKWIYDLILTCQGIDLILAHLGGGFLFFELMPEVKELTKRVYYDTAACPFIYSSEFYSVAARIVRPERILFGSDYPLINQTRYLKDIKNCGLSKENVQKILGKNAQELLGL